MEKWKGIKCQPGYIHKQKIFQSIMLAVFVLIGVIIFLTGLWITKTRANVFTVLGILMVLPAAKRAIAVIVMMPNHSVSEERYAKLCQAVPESATILSDYVFTSTEKVMAMDFVVVQSGYVYGIKSERKMDTAYMKEYLQKCVMGVSDYKVKIFENDGEFYKFYQNVSAQKADAKQEEVVKQLKVLAV